MLNSIQVMGRLISTPVLKKTSNGVSVCRFTLAVDRDYVAKGGERECDFIDILVWRRSAEFIDRNKEGLFAKGHLMVVSGALHTSWYKDSEGINRKSVEVEANHIYPALSPKNSEPQSKENEDVEDNINSIIDNSETLDE